MVDPDRLGGIPLFSMLTRAERERLAPSFDEVVVPAGQQIISQGQANDTFFVVREGLVEVSVPGKATVVLGAGNVLGEISMDRRVPATATVTTRTEVHAYVMSHAQFRALQANDPLLLRLRALMVERLLANR